MRNLDELTRCQVVKKENVSKPLEEVYFMLSYLAGKGKVIKSNHLYSENAVGKVPTQYKEVCLTTNSNLVKTTDAPTYLLVDEFVEGFLSYVTYITGRGLKGNTLLQDLRNVTEYDVLYLLEYALNYLDMGYFYGVTEKGIEDLVTGKKDFFGIEYSTLEVLEMEQAGKMFVAKKKQLGLYAADCPNFITYAEYLEQK